VGGRGRGMPNFNHEFSAPGSIDRGRRNSRGAGRANGRGGMFKAPYDDGSMQFNGMPPFGANYGKYWDIILVLLRY